MSSVTPSLGESAIPALDRKDPAFAAHLSELLFNQLDFGRVPDVIVRPRHETDVARAVAEAVGRGQKVAILSGGHSWIGAPARNGGVLLDLSALNGIDLDVEGRTVRVGPAARGGEVTRALTPHGLAYPSGHCSTPGSGGYLLGGGIGLNSGHWNPACYSVRRARVVTAAGDIVEASETENPDLLWMLRGAGPLFPGVVTEFEIELRDRPADTRVSSWVFDMEDLAAVSRWVDDASRSLPSYVEVFTAVSGPDRHEHRPDEGYPERIVSVIAMAFVDDEDAAREALAPLDAAPGVAVLAHESLVAVPFESLAVAFDVEYPEGHRIIADAFWVDEDVEGALMPLRETFRSAPSGKNNYIALKPAHGAIPRFPEGKGAYSMEHRTLVMAYAIWQDPTEDEANRAWMAQMSRVLETYAVGNFISEADLEAYPQRAGNAFSPENWERLRALRTQWDPENVFHVPGKVHPR